MSTPRRRRFGEGVNALFASLFILTIGLMAGFVAGVGVMRESNQAEVSAGYLSLAGKPYRVQPMEFGQ